MIRLRYLTLSVLAVLIVVSTVPLVSSDVLRGEFTVPNWVKNTAGWWADELIDDSSFVSSIQWLVTNDIIILSPTEQGIGGGDIVIPSWIKNTAGWWVEDKIHDVVFVGAIRYLINEGIMVVMEPQVEVAKCNFKGKEVVCSLTEKEVVEINDFYMEVNGGSCSYCVNWAHVGKEYNFQIATLDKKLGNYIDGVEISAKIISKGGELRQNLGAVTTEDGIYKSSITIPSMDWYAENILSVTGTYNGVEKTIEKEFTVFAKKTGGSPSCHTVNPFSVADQETSPNGIAFSTDGRKMFIVGSVGDDVNEYSLSIPYCLSTAKFVDATSISAQDTTPTDIAFNSDGTKMFILGAASDEINEYALSTGFDASSRSFTDVVRVNTQETAVSGIAFNSDGTKMFIVGFAGDDVNEYALSTAFDTSTRSFTDDTSISSQETNPKAIAFNSDGTKMFIVGGAGDDVNEYALSTAFDASTRSFTDATSISSQETTPRGIVFSSDGMKMFIVGSDGDEVNEYVLTTAWDASTLSFK